MEPLVSVNITTYNRAHLLPRALNSILSQEYGNIEVNVVDDHSDDDTLEVVRHFQKHDPRIELFHHKKNKGNAEARNTALKNCNGMYVAFMDDDDEWIDKEKISKQVGILNFNSDIGIVCSSVRIYKNEKEIKDKYISRPDNIVKYILSKNGIIYSPTVMTREKTLREASGFDAKLSKGVDSDFYRKCIVHLGVNVWFMPEITTVIYEHNEERMTPVNNMSKTWQLIRRQFYVLWKYKEGFINNPQSASERLKKIIFAFPRLFKSKIKIQRPHKQSEHEG